MKFIKLSTSLKMKTCRSLKLVMMSLSATIVLAGCNGNNSDKSGESNASPTTTTVDLITQTEIPITTMLSASDDDGDSLSFNLVQQAILGEVSITDKGEFTYQPDTEVTGSDSFTYTVTDGINPEVTGRVNISIEALQVSFASYSREVFNQQSGDKPLAVNGRVFNQDVESATAYDDLISQ